MSPLVWLQGVQFCLFVASSRAITVEVTGTFGDAQNVGRADDLGGFYATIKVGSSNSNFKVRGMLAIQCADAETAFWCRCTLIADQLAFLSHIANALATHA